MVHPTVRVRASTLLDAVVATPQMTAVIMAMMQMYYTQRRTT